MKITAGGIPLGEDFYPGRQAYVDHLGRLLSNGDVMVIGPRRTGKTCVIQEYLRQREAADKKIISVFIDLESVQDLYEFYLRIIKKVLSATKKWKYLLSEGIDAARNLSNALKRILEIEADLAPYLGSEGEVKVSFKMPDFDPKKVDQLSMELCKLLARLNTEIVIVLDEFPELIWKFGESATCEETFRERVSKTQFLMNGFRSMRQEPAKGGKSHRFVIAGSINLDNTLQYLGLDQTVNDLQRLRIPYLQPSQALELMQLLCKAERFAFDSPAEFDQLLNIQFGCSSPFYVQLYAEILRQAGIDRLGQTKFSQADATKAYKDLLCHSKGPRYLITRIERYYKDDKDLVLKILEILARVQFESDAPCKDEDLYLELQNYSADFTRERYSHLMARLLADDLVQNMSDGSCIGFESQVLCNFWHFRLVDARFLK
jgi:AAA domain